MTRYKNKQHNEADSYQDGKEQNHQGASVHQLPNVRFLDVRPVHECVFAETCQRKDRINRVLLRRQRIDTNRER